MLRRLFLIAFAATAGLAQSSTDREYGVLLRLHEDLLRLAVPQSLAGWSESFEAAQQGRRERLDFLKRELRALDSRSWRRPRQVDYALVASRWNELDFEMRVSRPWQRDPGYYLDLIRRPAFAEIPVPAEDFGDLMADLEAVPAVLSKARKTLERPARELIELALFHLDRYDGVGQAEPLRMPPPAGLAGWFKDFRERAARQQPELVPPAERVIEALEGFRGWLEQQLETTSEGAAVGLDHYQWFVSNVRLMPYSVAEIRALGNRELERSSAFLQIDRSRNRKLPQLELAVSKEEYELRVEAAEKRIRSFLTEQRLLSLPAGLAPFQTDAFWRAGMKRHFWEEIQYRDALNNHIHASIPGHRFDRIIASRVSNPIRAGHRDGGRIEGWAFYVEEMLLQAGLLEHRPRARELFYIAQLARAVRIPTELKMQGRELDLEQAIDYMVDQVPLMEENLARYDLEVYLRRPTYGMNYVMGRIQMERLLSDRARQLGDEFDLGAFHDEFLSYGWIPISLIRWEMTGLEDEVGPLLEGLLNP